MISVSFFYLCHNFIKQVNMMTRYVYILFALLSVAFLSCRRNASVSEGESQINEENRNERPQQSQWDSQRDETAEEEEEASEFEFDATQLMVKMDDDTPSQILKRKAYVTSYNHDTRCPNWVAWQLTGEHTTGPYKRNGVPFYASDGKAYGIGRVTEDMVRGNYIIDMQAEEPRQQLEDWSHEYNMSHGHICPAGDNKWDKAAMNQTFLLTNMCPQDRTLNSGGWNKVEEKCRKWANRFGEVFIVAGPIFRNTTHRKLGDIPIPEAFYKVILCMNGSPKAIGFIYENNPSSQSMQDTMCSVDDVERLTGFDFFSQLPDDVENDIEATCNLYAW